MLVVTELLTASLYGAGAFLAAFAAMSVLRSRRSLQKVQADHSPVYLIRQGCLVDANSSGQHLLDAIDGHTDPMGKLVAYLSTQFGNVSQILESPTSGVYELKSKDQKSTMVAKATGNNLRVQISSMDESSESTDVHALRALKTELATLRANARAAPFLLWRQDKDGQITWVNQAYLDTLRMVGGDQEQPDWPLPAMFRKLSVSSSKTSRLALQRADQSEMWFDCHVTPVGRDFLCTAFEADEAVRSENKRREFTQTLTKTFAELAIGLAIFDRSRNLVLFNPALLDLTNLPTDFLMARPRMVNFLDRLRENRVMPEPRDYRTWRKNIAELEAESVNGTYDETWSLPNGQTYHVTGRPHPDGAVALMFEDISAEISLTRRFRAELEQSQSVFDALEDGIAMFSATGQLTHTNKAYHDLWQEADQTFLIGSDVNDITRRWSEHSFPTPAWGDFREFAHRTHDREEWQTTVSLRDGRAVSCRFVPQKGGATLVVFRLITAEGMTRDGLQKAV